MKAQIKCSTYLISWALIPPKCTLLGLNLTIRLLNTSVFKLSL